MNVHIETDNSRRETFLGRSHAEQLPFDEATLSGPVGWTGPRAKYAACYSSGMVRRAIEIDEDTDRLLMNLAAEYEGDLSLALADLVHVRDGLEELAERSEAANEPLLKGLRDRSEADFRDGRTVAWEDIKVRNSL